MEQDNKDNIIKWLKILAIIAYAIATIITCSAVWNSKPDVFISLVALALFAVNGYIVYRKAKALKDKPKE